MRVRRGAAILQETTTGGGIITIMTNRHAQNLARDTMMIMMIVIRDIGPIGVKKSDEKIHTMTIDTALDVTTAGEEMKGTCPTMARLVVTVTVIEVGTETETETDMILSGMTIETAETGTETEIAMEIGIGIETEIDTVVTEIGAGTEAERRKGLM